MHVVDGDTMTQHLFLIKIKKGESIGRWWDVRVGWKRHTEGHREKERERTRGTGEGLKLALQEVWGIP